MDAYSPNIVSVNAMIHFLNTALYLDPQAINALFSYRVPCNEAIADHPTIQVLQETPESVPIVGLMGLLNGAFGVDEEDWGFIAMDIDDEGVITSFYRTSSSERNGGKHASDKS